MTRVLTTVLSDPSPLYREGLRLILSGTRSKISRAVATIGEIGLNSLPKSRQFLFILGCDDKHPSSLTAIRELREQFPSSKLVVMSNTFDPAHVVSMLQSGANGYILKSTSCEALINSLELVLLGEIILPSEYLRSLYAPETPQPAVSPVTAAVLENTGEGPSSQHVRKLSLRESVVLRHLMCGDANKCIARQLGIADATVKVHIKAILRKIGVTNRTQAALWAVEHPEYLPPFTPPAQNGHTRNAVHKNGKVTAEIW